MFQKQSNHRERRYVYIAYLYCQSSYPVIETQKAFPHGVTTKTDARLQSLSCHIYHSTQ